MNQPQKKLRNVLLLSGLLGLTFQTPVFSEKDEGRHASKAISGSIQSAQPDFSEFHSGIERGKVNTFVEPPIRGASFEQVKNLLSLELPQSCNAQVNVGESGISIALKTEDGQPFQLRVDSEKLGKGVKTVDEVISLLDLTSMSHAFESGQIDIGDYILQYSSENPNQVTGVLDSITEEEIEMSESDLARINRAIKKKKKNLYTACTISSKGQSICDIYDHIAEENVPAEIKEQPEYVITPKHKGVRVETVVISNLGVQNAEALGGKKLVLEEYTPADGGALVVDADDAAEGRIELDIAEIDGKRKVIGVRTSVFALEEGVGTGMRTSNNLHSTECVDDAHSIFIQR